MKKFLQKTLCRLHALLLLVVMFIGGGNSAWADNLTATFDLAVSNGQEGWSNNSITTNDVICQRSSNPASTGINLWQASHYIKISVPSEVKITKIVLRGLQGYFNGTSYGSINITRTNGSFEGGVTNWTNSSDATWENTEETSEVQFSTTYGNDFYVRYVDVYTGTLVDDGSVKSTFNFNQSSVPFVSSTGVAGNLQGGNRPSVGDVFTAPSGGATLTFNYVGESWSNSGQRLRLGSDASFTIAAPEGFEMTNIVFTTDTNTMTFSSKSGLTGNGSTKATWEGKSESETFTISANSWIQNIKVTMMPVAEEGEVTYNIDLVDAPAGAYVTLDGQTFNSDDTYTVEKSLGKSDLVAYEPEGYYADVEYTRDNHTYTVTYHAYNYYDVTVTGTTDPAAGVVYNETTYGNGSRIESKDVLTESSVSVAAVDGLSGSVSLSGNTFTVAYKKPAYVEFVLGGEVSVEKAGVTFSLSDSFMNQGENGLDVWKSSWYFTINSSQFDIEKIELFNSYDSSMTGLGSTPSGFSSSNNTWTGNARSVEFKGLSTFTSDYYIVKARVYLVGYDGNEEENERECVMDVASTFFSTGNVEQINSNLTFVADVNTEGDHSGGAVPDGVTLVDDNSISYTVSSMLWWDNDSQVVLNLPSAITAPGHYTLTIPEGAIPCVGNKANKEIVFTWHVLIPAPAFPEQGVAYEIKSVADDKFVTLDEIGLALDEVAEGFTFTWSRDDEAFIVKDKDENRLGGDTEFWTVESLGGEQYAFVSKSAGTYMSVDGETVVLDANAAYAFTLAEYVDPALFGAPASALALDDSGFYIGTYYADHAWTAEDVLVYAVTGIGANNQLQMQLVSGVVPANTGVILYSTESNSNIVIRKSAEEVAPIEGNLLDGTVEATDGVGGDGATYYVLSKRDGKLGFYWDPRTQDEGATLNNGAHKAYLRIPASAGSNKAAGYFFDFGEGTITGIESLNVEGNDAIYNLQGQRVNATKSGVYVKNGRKVIVK